MCKGVWGDPHTPLPAASAASGALSLPVERKAKSHQRRADEHQQQGVGGHHVPDGFDQVSQSSGIFQNLGNGDGGSSLLKSTLLSKKIMDAGEGIEPPVPASKTGLLPLQHPAM